jgi:hypothetical protein
VPGQALARPSASGLDRLRQQFAPRATDDDLGYFAEVCRHLDVDPWAGHICLMGWTDTKTGELVHRPTLTVAGRRFIAQRTGHLRGIEGPVWCGPRRTPPGVNATALPLDWLEMWDQDVPPYAARCLVFRDDWDRPANGTVKWTEFAQTYQPKGGGDRRPTGTWAAMPSHMLGKVAESLALRRAFAEVAAAVAYVDDDDAALTHEVDAEVWASATPPTKGRGVPRFKNEGTAADDADLVPAPPSVPLAPPPDVVAPVAPDPAPPAVGDDVAALSARLNALPPNGLKFFTAWRRSRAFGPMDTASPEALAEMSAFVTTLEGEAKTEAETYGDAP